MTLISSFRSRRLTKYKPKSTQKLIAFRLRQEWFALPIQALVKVIILDKIYGDPQQTGLSLTTYQNQEILVVDVGYHIFSEPQRQELMQLNQTTEPQYLAIVQNSQQEIVGLPIDSPPVIHQVSESAFKPLPQTYLALGKIKAISSKMVEIENKPSLFLLDPEKLLQNWLNS